MELEADHIGMLLLARSGTYHPQDCSPELPKSRKLELEADHIGMLLLANSCAYRPQESVEMLNRISGSCPCRIAQNLMRGILKEVPAAESWDWEFYVINDPANINAFALAGGKVFVFTGLFKVAPTEGLLAAVVGHEIGHALARHHAEQNVVQWFKSFMTVVALLVGVDMASINVLDWLASMGLQLPKSRQLELEADHIGMLLLARSCAYRPQESVEMLNRLRAATGDTGGVLARASSYFNTHPAGEDRVAAAIKQLPSALAEMKRMCPEYVHHLKGKAHAAQLPSATQIRAVR
ncbi:peptidase family M48-domain-containing protein [Tribonema minus]|uniref:Peptidase family M48-domain-containing protein n=1 Tax=Tribonema minus TaxID=303371 RepID=A0A835ZJB7_9STRA|nr:peptidase family M48-domain-containing protein [Tribonema minus]